MEWYEQRRNFIIIVKVKLFIIYYLIKVWIVAFLDVCSLCLASHSYFDNRFDIDARQLPSLDDSHPYLNIESFVSWLYIFNSSGYLLV